MKLTIEQQLAEINGYKVKMIDGKFIYNELCDAYYKLKRFMEERTRRNDVYVKYYRNKFDKITNRGKNCIFIKTYLKRLGVQNANYFANAVNAYSRVLHEDGINSFEITPDYIWENTSSLFILDFIDKVNEMIKNEDERLKI